MSAPDYLGSPTIPVIINDAALITTSLNPSWQVGTIGYWQDGQYGMSKGLLLSLTNTPQYKKMLMTDHGLRRIY